MMIQIVQNSVRFITLTLSGVALLGCTEQTAEAPAPWKGDFRSFSISKWDPGMQNTLTVTDTSVIWYSVSSDQKPAKCYGSFNSALRETKLYPIWVCTDDFNSKSSLQWNAHDSTWTLIDGVNSAYSETFVFRKLNPAIEKELIETKALPYRVPADEMFTTNHIVTADTILYEQPTINGLLQVVADNRGSVGVRLAERVQLGRLSGYGFPELPDRFSYIKGNIEAVLIGAPLKYSGLPSAGRSELRNMHPDSIVGIQYWLVILYQKGKHLEAPLYEIRSLPPSLKYTLSTTATGVLQVKSKDNVYRYVDEKLLTNDDNFVSSPAQ